MLRIFLSTIAKKPQCTKSLGPNQPQNLKLRHCIFRKWGGSKGGQRPFGNFSENSSILEGGCFPKGIFRNLWISWDLKESFLESLEYLEIMALGSSMAHVCIIGSGRGRPGAVSDTRPRGENNEVVQILVATASSSSDWGWCAVSNRSKNFSHLASVFIQQNVALLDGKHMKCK